MTTQPGNIGQYKRGCSNNYINRKNTKGNKSFAIKRGGKRGK